MPRVPSWLFFGLITVVGVAAFLYPFWIPQEAVVGESHGLTAPLVASMLVLLMVTAIAVELRQGRMNGATVALLGVLSASAGLLRLLDLPGGGSGIFFLVVLAGAAFGARFGLLLGLGAMALSAVITGGIGPWLPFQMLGLAWMGASAGWAGRLTVRLRPRAEVLALAGFGWVWGFAYGAVLNLWSWPFTIAEGPLAWNPSLSLVETLDHYRRFYLTTSLAWDAAGATANAILIVLIGAPILASLRRFAHRLAPVVVFEPTTSDRADRPGDGGRRNTRSGDRTADVVEYRPQREQPPAGGGSRSEAGAVPQP